MIVFIPFWLIGFASRRLADWLGSRAAAKALALSPDAPKPQLTPESTFVVEITELTVTCHRPDGQTETVRWDDLQKVDILTTSDGPLAPMSFGSCTARTAAASFPKVLPAKRNFCTGSKL